MENEKNGITQEDVANDLLTGLWANIETDYKKKYVNNIWEQFENAIKAATYTDKLTKFVEMFRAKIPCNLSGMYSKDIAIFLKNCKEDYEVLNWLREETTYLVMLVRMNNQARKESINKDKIRS